MLFVLFWGQLTFAQTIKLENYVAGHRFCPSDTTFLKFSARDAFNNKVSGEFRFEVYIDNSLYLDSFKSFAIESGGVLYYDHFFNYALETDANKNLELYVHYWDFPHNGWAHGFGVQSDDIRIEVEFEPWHGLWTVDEAFYVKSNVLEPGPAVVDGYNSLFFCSGGDIQNVKLVSPPPINHPDVITYCYWGGSNQGQWIWELPAGWKITSPTGNINTATNIYEGGDEVKIKAPTTLPVSATLNVRSEEDDWNWPINTETTIHLGMPPTVSEIKYNTDDFFPISIYYDPTNDTGTFTAQHSTSGAVYSYVWATNAGNLISNVSSPVAYVEFSGTGTGKYVKVRTYGDCGYSAWYTQYFNLQYDSQGCSGGGMFMMSVSPNPASEEFSIDIIDQQGDLEEKLTKSNYEFEITVLDENLGVVYSKKSKKLKNKVPVGKIKNGKYILRIASPDGVISERVIVNHN